MGEILVTNERVLIDKPGVYRTKNRHIIVINKVVMTDIGQIKVYYTIDSTLPQEQKDEIDAELNQLFEKIIKEIGAT